MSATTDLLIGHVRELIGLMSKGGISELDLSTGDVSIRLRGNSGVVHLASGSTQMVTTPNIALHVEPEGHMISAPMIGTYYASPAPGESPFVQIGDEVEVGQVIGIIEAMKIMNEIIADRSGIVTDILVENAQAVEYGSPLVRLIDQPNHFA
ncbi:MAG: acetyl-CoA carboxylase biotin carboxyl carrier protein [Thermomicrobiales bacterium]